MHRKKGRHTSISTCPDSAHFPLLLGHHLFEIRVCLRGSVTESYGVTYRGHALGVRTSNMDLRVRERTLCVRFCVIVCLFVCLNSVFETGLLYIDLTVTHYTDNASLELTD